MRESEFFALTPRMFSLIVKRHEAMVKREEYHRDYMLAQIIAMVANTGFARFENWRDPQEFLPRTQAAEAKPRRRNEKRFTDKMRLVMERAMAYQNANVARGIKQ